MRTYLVWYEDEKNGAVMDVTKVVEDAHALAPQLPRALIVTSLCSVMEANEIITANSEEEMLEQFVNVKKVTRMPRKEELH